MSIAELNAELITASPAPSDPELMERFIGVRDQFAFAELVRRHSPVVLGVCHRVLRDTNDIEDAFQATFLVLIRDARRVRKQSSLASWLYGVAYRISLQVTRQKRRRRETTLVDDNTIDLGILASVADRHDYQLLDLELNTLPERYRQPLVLRYLAGKSPSEVATELGLTVGAVDGLLKRGKDELRQRLLKRGVTVGTALAAIQLAQESTCAAASEALIEATVQSGLAWDFPSSSFAPEQISIQQISTRALELAGKEVLVMTTGTKAALTIGLTLSGLALATGAIGHFGDGSQGTVEAAGIVSTLSALQGIENVASIATIMADPAPDADSKLANSGEGRPRNDAGIQNTTVNSPESEPADLKLNAKEGLPNLGLELVQLPKPAKKRWDTKKRSAKTQQILSELDENAEANFVDVPLKEAIDVFKSTHGIAVLFDNKALSEDGISTDSPVNLQVDGIPLKNTLRLLLDPLQLDYVLENDLLVITTQTRAQSTFETRVYSSPDHIAPMLKELIEVIQKSVEPGSWKTSKDGDGDGEGTISTFEHKLIIRQTQRIHDEINEFLDELLGAQEPDQTNEDFRNNPGF